MTNVDAENMNFAEHLHVNAMPVWLYDIFLRCVNLLAASFGFGSSDPFLEQYFHFYMACMEGHRQSSMKFMNALGTLIKFK